MSNNLLGDTRFNALIVDDEPAILTILTHVLEDHNFTVRTAPSGEDAVAMLREETVDVLLTDIRMHGISGFELIDRVASVDPAVKTIVMTSHDSYDMIKQAMRTGAYDYLGKPLNDHGLICMCATRAAHATKLERDNNRLVEELRANHTMLENANDKLLELNEELRIQANTDSLTDIYNRRFLDKSMLSEIMRRNRYPDPLSLAMIDVDHFKQFNDKHGHAGGDKVLKAIAAALTTCARNTDVVGRYGGEEFMVILPKTSPENALLFAERVREHIAMEEVDIEGKACLVTVSVGVAGVDTHFINATSEMLVEAADKALYAAKESGRDRIRFFSIEQPEDAEKELKRAS